MGMKVKGFLDPMFIPLIVVALCMFGLITIKVLSKGHETPTEQVIEEALEGVMKHELLDKPE